MTQSSDAMLAGRFMARATKLTAMAMAAMTQSSDAMLAGRFMARATKQTAMAMVAMTQSSDAMLAGRFMARETKQTAMGMAAMTQSSDAMLAGMSAARTTKLSAMATVTTTVHFAPAMLAGRFLTRTTTNKIGWGPMNLAMLAGRFTGRTTKQTAMAMVTMTQSSHAMLAGLMAVTTTFLATTIMMGTRTTPHGRMMATIATST